MKKTLTKFTPALCKKYVFKDFKPYLKDIDNKKVSCGGQLVSIITHIPIKDIGMLHPDDKDGWTNEWVMTFLKLMGYSTYEIPKGYQDTREKFEIFFGEKHLMIYILGIDGGENTWACSYGDKMYHGQRLFEGVKVGAVLINCPIEAMWMCCPTKQLSKSR